jgi:transposase
MRNILEKMRRRDYDAVKTDAQAIYRAESRRQAEVAFRAFGRRWQTLYSSMVVPRPAIRELRGLTRYRAVLAREPAAVGNRIQKILEDANIKRASVSTDIPGQSGCSMLAALVAGEQDSGRLAERMRDRLRGRSPNYVWRWKDACASTIASYSSGYWEHLEFVECQTRKLESEIERRTEPCREAVARWTTIPGIEELTAWNLVAEIGVEMERRSRWGRPSVVTRGEQIHIPAETILEFRLQQPASLPRS